MHSPLVVIGAGGFGREALDIVDAINAHSDQDIFETLGVIDDNPSPINLKRLHDRGVRHLGGLQNWLAVDQSANYVIAVGNPIVRRNLENVVALSDMRPVSLIHPTVIIGSQVKIGLGSILCSGAQISTNVRIGDHVHINPAAIIGHDTQIADFVSVNPGAVVSGEVVVGEASLLGANSTVLQGLRIELESTIGAGAVVVRAVPPGTIVKGVPAR
jgi:sugar O-acyltransferase (sialic acid O-acetyltransferase NeuD family)